MKGERVNNPADCLMVERKGECTSSNDQATTKQRHKKENGPRRDANECAFCDSHGKLTGGWVWALCALWGCLGVAARCLQKQRTATVTRPATLRIRKTSATTNQIVCMPRIVDASESEIQKRETGVVYYEIAQHNPLTDLFLTSLPSVASPALCSNLCLLSSVWASFRSWISKNAQTRVRLFLMRNLDAESRVWNFSGCKDTVVVWEKMKHASYLVSWGLNFEKCWNECLFIFWYTHVFKHAHLDTFFQNVTHIPTILIII